VTNGDHGQRLIVIAVVVDRGAVAAIRTRYCAVQLGKPPFSFRLRDLIVGLCSPSPQLTAQLLRIDHTPLTVRWPFQGHHPTALPTHKTGQTGHPTLSLRPIAPTCTSDRYGPPCGVVSTCGRTANTATAWEVEFSLLISIPMRSIENKTPHNNHSLPTLCRINGPSDSSVHGRFSLPLLASAPR
jgi:hypothetical protein